VITEATMVYDAATGTPVAGYLPRVFASDLAAELAAIRTTGPSKLKINHQVSPNGQDAGSVPTAQGRLSGISVPSRTFGAIPVQAARRRYNAQFSSADLEYPHLWRKLTELASRVYRERLRPLELPFGDVNDSIHATWKIKDTPFTSAIVNLPGANYPYHRDSGNLPGSWSMQLNVRGRFHAGGILVFPNYDIGFACEHGSVCVFPGGGAWHGVTPIRGQRISIVFYAKAGLTGAEPTVEAELAAGNRRRTAYETRSRQDVG